MATISRAIIGPGSFTGGQDNTIADAALGIVEQRGTGVAAS
jgi:hypothetical protein